MMQSIVLKMLLILLLRSSDATKRKQFIPRTPMPVFTINKIQINYQTITGYYTDHSIAVLQSQQNMPPILVSDDLLNFRMDWNIQIESLSPDCISLHHQYQFMNINHSKIFPTNPQYVSQTTHSGLVEYTFPVIIDLTALEYRREIRISHNLKMIGVDGSVTNYQMRLQNTFVLQPSLIKQVIYSFDDVSNPNIITNPFHESPKIVTIPIKANLKSMRTIYQPRLGHMELISLTQNTLAFTVMLHPNVMRQFSWKRGNFKVDASYQAMFVGGATSKNYLIHPNALHCRHSAVLNRVDCSLRLHQLTIRHSKHAPVLGFNILYCMQFAPTFKQKIRFYLVTQGVSESSSGWSKQLSTANMLFSHYLRYAYKWHDIEAPEYMIDNNRKDMLLVDRHFAFNPLNVVYYLQNMHTKKGNVWNLLDLYQYPFTFEVIHYMNELGIDEGALTQDFFDNIFVALAKFIGTNAENGAVLHSENSTLAQQSVLCLMRSWNLCWKMNEKWKEKSGKQARETRDFEAVGGFNEGINTVSNVDIDCRFHAKIINPLYFEIAFGKIDELIANGNIRRFVAYIAKLEQANLVSSWLIGFCKQYLDETLDAEQEKTVITEFMDGIYGEDNHDKQMPKALNTKMKLIRDYLYVIEFKGIIDIISSELYFFGLWLDYRQFSDIFFTETSISEPDICKLVTMIQNNQNWLSGKEVSKDSQLALQTCLTKQIEQHYYEDPDTEWIQTLLQFWTGRKWKIPEKIQIDIQSVENPETVDKFATLLAYLPKAMSCYNKLILNDILVYSNGEGFNRNDCIFMHQALDIAVQSVHDGFNMV